MAKKPIEIKPAASKKFEMLQKVCSEIQKKYGKESVNFLGNNKVEPIPRITSGSIAIDKVTGGGYPLGRTIELFGGASVGKTTACYHAIAEAQKAYPDKWCGFIDSEYCLAKGTLVYNAGTGIYERIEDIDGKEMTVLSHVDGRFVEQNAIVKYSGNRVALKISCSYSREITVTENHRLLTGRGWLRADEVRIGDVLYTPDSLPSNPSIADDDEKYKLLGYWLGDGTIGKAEVATIDDFIATDVERLVDKHFDAKVTFTGTTAMIVKRDFNCYDISREFLVDGLEKKMTMGQLGDIIGCSADTIRKRIADYGLDKVYNIREHSGATREKIPLRKDRVRTVPFKSKAFDFLSSFDVFNKHSYERYIPENLTLGQLRHVIAGLLLSDGTVVDPAKNHRCSIGFSTTSEEMAYGIQAGLQKFGIFSSFGSSTKRTADGRTFRKCYFLVVNGKNEVRKFHDQFGDLLVGYKKERIERSLREVREQHTYTKDIKNGLVAVDVRSIEAVDAVDTYDVSVANEDFDRQNFLANGLIVHNSFDAEYATNIGVNVAELVVAQPDSGTDGFAMVQGFIENGASLIVVDSVAAMVPREEAQEEDYGKASVGTQARMMSKALRKLTAIIGKSKCVVIFTNQTRDKVGVMYGNPEVTSGGKALQFYASIRLKLSRAGIIEEGTGDDKEKVSVRTRVEAVKNKTFPPFRKAEYVVVFGRGIDNDAGILDVAIENDIVLKKGGWYAYNGSNVAQGLVNLKKYLADNPAVYAEIKDRVKDLLGDDHHADSVGAHDCDADVMSDDDIASAVEDDTESGNV